MLINIADTIFYGVQGDESTHNKNIRKNKFIAEVMVNIQT